MRAPRARPQAVAGAITAGYGPSVLGAIWASAVDPAIEDGAAARARGRCGLAASDSSDIYGGAGAAPVKAFPRRQIDQREEPSRCEED